MIERFIEFLFLFIFASFLFDLRAGKFFKGDK